MKTKFYLEHLITGKRVWVTIQNDSTIDINLYWRHICEKDSPHSIKYYNTGEVQEENFIYSVQEGIAKIVYYKSGKIKSILYVAGNKSYEQIYYNNESPSGFSEQRNIFGCYVYEKRFYTTGQLAWHQRYALNEKHDLLDVVHIKTNLYPNNKSIRLVEKTEGYLVGYKYYCHINYIYYTDSSKDTVVARISYVEGTESKKFIIKGLDSIHNFALLS